MPNWTTNRIRINRSFRDVIINAEGEVDFEILVPMPECLKLGNSGMHEKSIYVYLSNKGQVPSCEVVEPMKRFFSYIDEAFVEGLKQKIHENTVDEDYERGKRELENYLETGFFDWYDWSLQNWGCKWPASDSFIEDTEGADIMEIWFNTPWNGPFPWLEVLAKQPGISFDYVCTDECYGIGVCDAHAENGCIEYRDLNEEECMAISVELMGELTEE